MSRGRWAFVAIAIGIAAAVAVAVAAPGDGQEPTGAPDQGQHRTGASYRDQASRFGIEIPAGWRRAREVVDGKVINPREILVVSTFPLDFSGEPCGPFYDHVLGDLGRRQGFVSLQERFVRSVTQLQNYPRRPERFRLPVRTREPRGCGRNHERTLVRDWWIPFRDAGRAFYAQVAIGLGAPDQVRRDAIRLLDSLHFKRHGAASG